MSGLQVEASIRIDRRAADVIAVLRDIAGQHEWWPGQYLSEPLESDEQGRITRARIGNDIKIAKDAFEVIYDHEAGDGGYSWTLAAPSTLQRDHSGSWELQPDGDATETTLRIMVDSTLPLPGFLLRKALQDTVDGATEGLRARCED